MMASVTRHRVHLALAIVSLFCGAALMQAGQSRGWLRMVKKPLPIRKKLDDLSRGSLAPLEFVSTQRLPTEIVEELGTTEYLNWVVRESTGGGGKGRNIYASVTYYTGVVDQVPHVPEECMAQGAFTQDSTEIIEMELPTVGRNIVVRRLTFYPPRDLTVKTYVYYTFSVNGDFFATRNGVRQRMADLFDSHLYYSKVEISIKGRPDALDRGLDDLARQTLDLLIAELIKSHWPPKGWERGGPRETAPEPSSAAVGEAS